MSVLADSFKPEVRSRGESELEDLVVGSVSGTSAKGYSKAFRISLLSKGIESDRLTAECTCSQFSKGRLCRHIWSLIFVLEERGAEILANKVVVEPYVSEREVSAEPPSSGRVRTALDYFEKNGFTFAWPLDEFELKQAKRQLSRVFHPDRGGTHEELILLNRNYEILSGEL